MNVPNISTDGLAPVYAFLEGDMVLHTSVHEVWGHLINYASWQNYSIVEHVSGPSGGVGEIVLLKKEEGGGTSRPYFARTIKIEPERRIVWKTYRDTLRGFGIVDFSVAPVGDDARFIYRSLYEIHVPSASHSELEKTQADLEQSLRILSVGVFAKLKALAERR